MGMRVGELWRYPVKSLAGEQLEVVEISPAGIPGDRVVQAYDAEGRIVTSRTSPRLLGLQGTLGPDGQPLVNGLPWTSPGAAAAIEAAVGPGARLARDDGPDRFDVLPLLVATDGAIDALGLDRRRFPPERPRGRRGRPGRAHLARPPRADRRGHHRLQEAPRPVRHDDLRPRHARTRPDRPAPHRAGDGGPPRAGFIRRAGRPRGPRRSRRAALTRPQLARWLRATPRPCPADRGRSRSPRGFGGRSRAPPLRCILPVARASRAPRRARPVPSRRRARRARATRGHPSRTSACLPAPATEPRSAAP